MAPVPSAQKPQKELCKGYIGGHPAILVTPRILIKEGKHLLGLDFVGEIRRIGSPGPFVGTGAGWTGV